MRKAVALRYNPRRNEAPQVVASGYGPLAEKIIQIARESKVPLFENKDLVRALLAIPVGEEIPPELYEVVAQVLVFVYGLDQQNTSSKGSQRDS
ncbi:MAG: flagellar biosynthesis [Firmicutes bacterium]|jgi:flagellar biosynthesis protein|nr:flagellar biosynthesis [Bacillota bacterium]